MSVLAWHGHTSGVGHAWVPRIRAGRAAGHRPAQPAADGPARRRGRSRRAANSIFGAFAERLAKPAALRAMWSYAGYRLLRRRAGGLPRRPLCRRRHHDRPAGTKAARLPAAAAADDRAAGHGAVVAASVRPVQHAARHVRPGAATWNAQSDAWPQRHHPALCRPARADRVHHAARRTLAGAARSRRGGPGLRRQAAVGAVDDRAAGRASLYRGRGSPRLRLRRRQFRHPGPARHAGQLSDAADADLSGAVELRPRRAAADHGAVGAGRRAGAGRRRLPVAGLARRRPPLHRRHAGAVSSLAAAACRSPALAGW